eukprot:m.1215446 g.1215446  ORF g.1215446 m.1215446 type:complete len:1279 (+) comp24610_c1_seq2:71-3907(+)
MASDLRRILDRHGVDHTDATSVGELQELIQQYIAVPEHVEEITETPTKDSTLFACGAAERFSAANTSQQAALSESKTSLNCDNSQNSTRSWLQNASFRPSTPNETFSSKKKKSGKHDRSDGAQHGTETSKKSKIKHSRSTVVQHREPRHASGGSGKTVKDTASTGKDRQPSTTEDSLWRLDERGDKQNLQYRGLYKGDVVNYHRSSELCLCRKRRVTIHFNDNRQARRNRGHDGPLQRKSSRYFSSAAFKKFFGPTVTPKRLPSKLFQVPRKKRWDSTANAKPASFISLYAHPANAADTSAGVTEGSTSHLEGTDEGESHDGFVLRRTAAFNRALADNPADTSTWLAFVAFQDDALCPPGTRRNDALINEKKISIFERAIKERPHDEVLIAKYLDLCRQKHDLSEVESKWKRMIFTHASSPLLWTEYLAFFTSELSRFQVSKAQAQFHKALETLSAIKIGSFASHKMDKLTAEQLMVDIATSSCYFQRDSGYGEKALACFQALLEYTVFLPALLHKDGHQKKLQSTFENFWESETPRFGDDNAEGFASWYAKQHTGTESFTVLDYANSTQDPSYDLSALLPWQRWVQLETWRERAHWRAWRAQPALGQTEEDCDDVDRMVLFDDVAGHLVLISNDVLRAELVYRFLDFVGAPMRRRFDSLHTYTQDRYLGMNEIGRQYEELVGIVTSLRASYQEAEAPFRDTGVNVEYTDGHGRANTASGDATYPFSIDAGVDKRVWGQDGVPFSLVVSNDGWLKPTPEQDAAKRHFVCNCFEQALVWHPTSVYLKLSFIDFLAMQPDGIRVAKKRCKAMLKHVADRNNLELLDRYAQLEAALGKLSDAQKIYDTAISMVSAGSEMQRQSPYLGLCRHYAELMLDNGNATLAVDVLRATVGEPRLSPAERTEAAAPSQFVQTPTQIVKTRRAFERLVRELVTGAPDGVPTLTMGSVHAVACYAMYESLVADLGAAITVYETVGAMLARLDDAVRTGDTVHGNYSLHRELLLEQAARYVLWHSLHRDGGAPTAVRRLVLNAMELYPANPTLMTVFIGFEIRHGIAGRIRKYFDRVTSKGDGLVSPVIFWFAVIAELVVPHGGASIYRVRRLLERASADQLVRRNPLVWRMWLEFERAQASSDADIEAAKNVFYRGIQNCPGVKVLYLDGTSRVPTVLREVLDIIQEKELHLRAPIEELELLAQEEEEQSLARRKESVQQQEQLEDEVNERIRQEDAERFAQIRDYVAQQEAGTGDGTFTVSNASGDAHGNERASDVELEDYEDDFDEDL